jgi:hypothetical protein
MKRTIVIAASVLILAIIWYYLDGKEEIQKRDKSAGVKSSTAAGGKSPAVSDRALPSNKAPKGVLTNDDLKILALTEEDLKTMFDAAVEFYGRVLDQHDNPVKGAKIRCSWPFMGPQQNARELLTDENGRFEVKDLKAIAVKISVYPPHGYQRLPAEEGKPTDFIQIADPPDRIKRHEYYKALPHEMKSQMLIAEAYKPDKNKPMTFRLQRLER